MNDFYERLHAECGVPPPEKDDQDWGIWAGNYRDISKYLTLYKVYSAKMNDWQRYLLMNMIVQELGGRLADHARNAETAGNVR